jgi:hypothetical protein
MLEEQRWGLAILVSQKLVRALPKPTWRVVLGEDQWRSSKALKNIHFNTWVLKVTRTCSNEKI